MGLYRRGKSKTFWFSITHRGKRIQESTGTESKKLAEKIFAKIYTDIVEGRYFEAIKARRKSFADMVDKFMTRYGKERHQTSLKHLMPVFGNVMLADITTEMVDDYRYERLKKVKPATVYQDLAFMRRMFNVARREWKWTRDNPVADLTFSVGSSNARDRWLSLEEEDQLLQSASPAWLKRVIVFALQTGMRRGEILYLRWSSVDFKRRFVTVMRSKNNQKRSIPMSNALYALLRAPKVINISSPVFPHSVGAVKDAFNRARDKAKLKDFRFHDLRHTFATRLVQNGVDLYKVKELLGHKTITMTMRYAHHCPESLRSSVEVLDKICYESATLMEIGDEAGLKNDDKSFKIKHGSV